MNIDLQAGGDYVGDRWTAAGLDKLIGAGLWKREFARGSYGSADAVVKNRPPSVEAVLAQIAARKAAEADAARKQAVHDERMRRPSFASATTAPNAKAAASAYSAAELAALINHRTGERPC